MSKRPMFTRRHYEAIAATIKAHDWPPILVHDVIRVFARMFEDDNLNFKRGKFLDACGV